MFEVEEAQDHDARERLARLEARVAELEAALTRALGMRDLAPSAEHFAKTQKLSTLAYQEETAQPAGDSRNMGLTAAFATLDTRVAEASDFESSLRKAPDLSHVVPIDASLIDEAFVPKVEARARTRPTARRIRSAIEEMHPKLLTRISAIWQSSECYEYLKRLIIDERGDREGFDPNVMSELLFLSQILEATATTDAWAANARPV
jgi:hypothetical protein